MQKLLEYYSRLAEVLDLEPFRKLPLKNGSNIWINSFDNLDAPQISNLGPNTLFLRFPGTNNFFLIVEFDQFIPKYYLLETG